MTRELQLEFALHDTVGSAEVSPAAVPLDLLKGFVREIAQFLKGDDNEVRTSKLLVSVVSGSLALRTEPLSVALPIWSDIERLASGFLDGVDPKRAQIARKWQSDALRHPGRRISVRDPSRKFEVTISADSNLRTKEGGAWVATERVLEGVLEDWGGAEPNLHVRLNDGRLVRVDATKEQLRQEHENFLYRTVLIGVSMEEDFGTGEQRNLRFREFVRHEPRFNEAEFEAATKKGSAAWSEVEDAVQWVRDIRGKD